VKSGTHSGFTIVEVMIVLAVSGLLLLGALVLVAGRQGESEFKVSANEFVSQLQETITNGINGQYPTNPYAVCTAGTNFPPQLSLNMSPTVQGSNSNCIFIGYVQHFYNNGTDSNQSYNTYPVVGRQCLVGSDVSTSCSSLTQPSDALPVLMAQGATINHSFNDTSVTNQTFENGISVGEMYTDGIPSQKTATIAYISDNLGTLSSLSATQQMGLYAMPSAAGNNLSTPFGNSLVDTIDGSAGLTTTVNTPVNEVDICLVSATSNESGLVKIFGNSGGQISVTLNVRETKTCP
jgi:prepilin-type N-terminal cleavage/methylation domain-containing protein